MNKKTNNNNDVVHLLSNCVKELKIEYQKYCTNRHTESFVETRNYKVLMQRKRKLCQRLICN